MLALPENQDKPVYNLYKGISLDNLSSSKLDEFEWEVSLLDVKDQKYD